MNRRQRRKQAERRAEHATTTRTPDRPLILERESFPAVKSSHIVPRMYQQAWAVDDQVAVHVDRRANCVNMSTRNAGTRSRYYRRTRPNGEKADDIEASLSYAEDKAAQPLKDLIAGSPITFEIKGGVAQLLALQMLRGPAFFAERVELLAPLIGQFDETSFKPHALAAADGDIDELRQRLTDASLGSTASLMSMLSRSIKMATLLSHMRWQIMRFDSSVLVYSDHPVVVWPMAVQRTVPFTRQGFAPLDALEIRVPIAPDAGILMTWIDLSDDGNLHLGPLAAAELNAFTIGQSDRQWMHRPGSEPSIAEGELAPVSRLTDPAYGRPVAVRSARRRKAAAFIRRVKNRRFVRDVEVLIDMPADQAPAA